MQKKVIEQILIVDLKFHLEIARTVDEDLFAARQLKGLISGVRLRAAELFLFINYSNIENPLIEIEGLNQI